MKAVDVDFLVFVERYASDLLRWDILSFFGHHPNFCGTATDIAHQIGRPSPSIRPDLGDLALVGILEQLQTAGGTPKYQLSTQPNIRRMAQKLANSQLATPQTPSA